MEQRHKDIIRDNYVQLVAHLKPAVEEVCTHLYQARIISSRMREDILEIKNPTRKAEALIDLIVRRGAHAFDALYLSFLHAELDTAADILKPIKAPHLNLAVSSESSAHPDSLPAEESGDSPERESNRSSVVTYTTSWLSEDHIRKENIKVKTVAPDSLMYKDYFESLKPLGQTFYYLMQHEIRGRVLIINNEKFIKTAAKEVGEQFQCLSDRDGSSCDRESLNILFKQLGFEVIIHDNKTAKEMNSIFKTESELDHTNYDCVIVFILSHGVKGKVFGSDGYSVIRKNQADEPRNFVQVKDIKHIICSTRTLLGKPKLFFIQACRGKHEDEGVELIAAGGATAESLESDREADMNLQDIKDALSGLEDKEVADGPTTIPSDADYFLAMSTVADKVSWRNSDYGTWFIQAIVYIFWNYSHEYDLHKLMTMANDLVCTTETKTKKKQVAEKRDTLRRTFCFFPGLLPNLHPPPRC